MSNLTVTTIDELKAISQGKVIELQGWDDETPFVARIKRPSLQIMCANGQIPNNLLGAASKMFTAGSKLLEQVPIADITKIQIAIAKASLIEPTYEQLEQAQLQLTDTQLSELFQYAMMGMAGLESFREKSRRAQDHKPVTSVQAKAK